MPAESIDEHALPVSPPNKHQLAVMIWMAVFPTLTFINLAFDGWLGNLNPVLRTFVTVSVAVPIVIYGILPYLQRLRSSLIARATADRSTAAAVIF